jgi:hypothetical protein
VERKMREAGCEEKRVEGDKKKRRAEAPVATEIFFASSALVANLKTKLNFEPRTSNPER